MIKEALNEFLTKVAADAKLQEELRAVTGEDGDSLRSDELVRIAAKHGYDFTVEDIRAADLELEEAELESVTGGASLSYSDVSGESQDDKHKGWIEILSCSAIIRYR